MKTIARKHYTQIDGTLTEDDALTLQEYAKKNKCLVISNNDQPVLAIAQTAKIVWAKKHEHSIENVAGYSTISFYAEPHLLKDGYFGLLFIDKDIEEDCTFKVKEGGIIFHFVDGKLTKTIQE